MRLIDLDKLAKKLKDRQDAAIKWRQRAEESGNDKAMDRSDQAILTFAEIKLTLDKMPKVDIVRCRECCHYENGCEIHDWGSRPNDYCSFGDRKEQTD